MWPIDITEKHTGIAFYIVCCIFAVLSAGWFALSEVLALQEQTEAQVQLIDQAVAKLDKVARK